METALYGPAGFYRVGGGPARHFRTSVHVSPLFAGALWRLVTAVDEALGHPARLDVVDVGAGGGELLLGLTAVGRRIVPSSPGAVPLIDRVRFTAVELADRPAGLPTEIRWRHDIPQFAGVLLANEWLDNVPLDIAELDETGVARYTMVNPTTGEETSGKELEPADAEWLARWWPMAETGERAELGRPRDTAWAKAVAAVRTGLALAIDYGHQRSERPSFGSLTGYANGRQVMPIPDGSCDITADVAFDSVRAAGEKAAGEISPPGMLVRQRNALMALGVSGTRPPRELASADPQAYLRQLTEAGAAAELTDRAGLGAFWWLAQPVGLTEAETTPVGEALGVGGSAT